MTITNIDSWPYNMALAFVCGGLLFNIINVGVTIYISHKYLPQLLEALPNSSYAQSISRNISQKSLISKSLVFSMISGLILFKKTFIREGDLCQSDMDRFPKKLKRIIKLELTFSMTTFIWMILIGILFKIRQGIPVAAEALK